MRFQRKDLSGSATGLIYDAAEGRLELMADVVLSSRIPTSAAHRHHERPRGGAREEGHLKFIGKVVVVQGGDRLKAGRFVVNIADETRRCTAPRPSTR